MSKVKAVYEGVRAVSEEIVNLVPGEQKAPWWVVPAVLTVVLVMLLS